ncbi:MAG: hypothetical protein JOZ16_06275 [Methylobacteriaceae bacterium]|nr:hypothetical protein [Methylobacteriaceae bacterium]
MSLRLAYVALIAVTIALRLMFAYPQASASDLTESPDRIGEASATQAGATDFDGAPLITGRSVAVRTSPPSDDAGAAEGRTHDGVGAAGFARR